MHAFRKTDLEYLLDLFVALHNVVTFSAFSAFSVLFVILIGLLSMAALTWLRAL